MVNKPLDIFTRINMHDNDPKVCWEWLGGLAGNGRPTFDVQGKRVTAYRLVYELFYGEKIPKGLLVRHKCDNQLCCNPHHMVLGTHQENMNDMKERSRHGLPAVTVKAIRKLLEEGITHETIAERFGVSRWAIGRIARGDAYQSVDEAAGGTDSGDSVLDADGSGTGDGDGIPVDTE